jgi:hypothetical protein
LVLARLGKELGHRNVEPSEVGEPWGVDVPRIAWVAVQGLGAKCRCLPICPLYGQYVGHHDEPRWDKADGRATRREGLHAEAHENGTTGDPLHAGHRLHGGGGCARRRDGDDV